jgi:hypothetical protein
MINIFAAQLSTSSSTKESYFKKSFCIFLLPSQKYENIAQTNKKKINY